MKRHRSIPILVLALAPMFSHAHEETCPTTVLSDGYRGPVEARPGTQWYGNEGLAVMLPTDGIWPTTTAGHLIAVKLFWWSQGFEPGMESGMHVMLADLGKPDEPAKNLRTSNAKAPSLGGWAMLTGIDLPNAGCFRISGRYRGEELSFVVQAIDAEAYIARHTTY